MRAKRRFLSGVMTVLVAMVFAVAHAAEKIKPLALSESIDMALKRSLLVHAAREGARGAEAERKEAFTGFLPKFSTAYSFTRLNEEAVFHFPGVPPLIPASAIKAGTKENYSWNIEVRQPLFAGGGIRANYEASRLGEEIARIESTVAELDLVQEVKIAYFNILKGGRMQDVARQSVERLSAHREMAQGFFDVGIIPKNDLLAAEVALANGRQFLLRAENSLEMAKAKFNTLLRREIDLPVEIEDTLGERPFAKSLDTCIAAAMENRPEIRSYAFRLERAKSLVKLARSEYYPNVGLVANYTRSGDTPGVAGSPYRDQENWYVMGVANWNFWEWGKTGNRVEAVTSRENQAADILINLREQIALEVKNGWLLLHEAEKQIHVTKKAIAQAEENFRINTERYREQVGTSTDVIDAQTLLTRARADHDNALGDFSISRARLERAMGIAVPDGMQ